MSLKVSLIPRLLGLAFILAWNGSTDVAAATRPNVIVILSDDMGYSDLGCYGSEVQTPNLNRLAAEGLRYTQFYNTARCCPTRASLLSGLYPHQAGIGWMMNDNQVEGYRGELNRQCLTLAEALKLGGYRNYMVGKWHVTKAVAPDGPKDNWPLQRGFDRFYGTIHGAGSFYDPNSLTRDNTMISPYADPEYTPKQYYYTDAISDHAVRFIREHTEKAQSEEPFFMYVAYTSAHWPMHALPRDIQKYKGRYDAGYEAIREERFQRMKELGVLPPHAAMSPGAESWESTDNKAWEAACMEVYAAMIDCMDQGIGRIVSTLRSTGQLDNTLILFMQDNGGCAETLGRKPRNNLTHRADGPTLPPMAPETLQKEMIPAQSRDGYPVLMGDGVLPGPADTYIAYGRGWANVSNTPFREYKHWVHEGGISTPLIAHWPAGIGRGGRLEHTPGHLIDIMATCLDVAETSYPVSYQGHLLKPLEGRSLRPTFYGQPIQREALYWEHEGNRAVRKGDWKLVAKGANGPWELYNIATDRSELTDLSGIRPEKVAELSALWEAYAQRADVYPLTPYYNKPRKANAAPRNQYQLKSGDNLGGDEAPDYAGKHLFIRLKVQSTGQTMSDGVLLAQGGSAHGYSIFIREGRLQASVRQSGQLSHVQLESKLPASTFEAIFELTRDGEMVLGMAKQEPVRVRLARPNHVAPQDGLQVGRDEGGLVGPYGDVFANPASVEADVRVRPR